MFKATVSLSSEKATVRENLMENIQHRRHPLMGSGNCNNILKDQFIQMKRKKENTTVLLLVESCCCGVFQISNDEATINKFWYVLLAKSVAFCLLFYVRMT